MLLSVVKMPAKIFVGNIAYGVTGDVIRPLFEHYGTVTECDILGSFGFVVSFLAAFLSVLLISMLNVIAVIHK